MIKQKLSGMTTHLITTVSLIVEILLTHIDLTLKLLESFCKGYRRMGVVTDTYMQLSIKNMEMQKQENVTTTSDSFIFIRSI